MSPLSGSIVRFEQKIVLHLLRKCTEVWYYPAISSWPMARKSHYMEVSPSVSKRPGRCNMHIMLLLMTFELM